MVSEKVMLALIASTAEDCRATMVPFSALDREHLDCRNDDSRGRDSALRHTTTLRRERPLWLDDRLSECVTQVRQIESVMESN